MKSIKTLNSILGQLNEKEESLEIMLRKSLSEEQLAVAQYEDRAQMCEAQGFNDVATMLREIADDERVHIGQLREAMKLLNLEDTQKDQEGQEEAAEFLEEPQQ